METIQTTMFSKKFFKNLEDFPESVVNTRKFDCALRPSPVLALFDNLNSEDQATRNTSLLLSHYDKPTILKCDPSPTLWPAMLSKVITDSNCGTDYSRAKIDESRRIFELMRKNMALQHGFLIKETVLTTESERRHKFEKWNKESNMSTPLLRNLIMLETDLSLLVERFGLVEHLMKSHKTRNNHDLLKDRTTSKIKSMNIKFSWSKRVLIAEWEDKRWILPSSYLLMLHNKVCDVLSSLILLQGSAGVCYEDDAYTRAVDFIRILAEYAITKPCYFEIAKSLEGLMIAEVLHSEEDWHNTSLLNSIIRDLQAEGFEYDGSELQFLFRNSSTPLKHELSGLSKVCGHPIIDMHETAEKARKRATDPVSLDYRAIQSTRNIALQMFIKSHILRHSEWPPVILDPLTPQYLVISRAQGRDPAATARRMGYAGASHDDYVFVTLLPMMELNKLDHYTQYLKDRAISLMRDTVIRNYVQKDYDVGGWRKTRLLLVHLFSTEDETDLGGYLRKYMRGQYSLDDVLNYIVIKLVPKEKEQKIAARPFGCKTYQERYRSCMQEENSRHFLDLYSSDQAMTLDNLGLIKRLHAFRSLSRLYQNWRVLYINFDVSGWCGNFRHATVEPIAKDLLDNIHGTESLFSKTQAAYEQGYFYLPDEHGEYHWEGQDGGIEGLEQCTWMTVYIPQMRLALQRYKLHLFVMAYGDDYKAALLIPPEQKDRDLGELKDQIVSLTAEFAKVSFGQKK